MFRHFFGPYPGFGAPWWWWPAHLLGDVLGLLFWVALIGLAVWALSRIVRGRPLQGGAPPVSPMGTPPPVSPMEIVRQRYARGEIDETTYMQMMERLSASEPPYAGQAYGVGPEGSPPPDYTSGPPMFGTKPV